MKFGVEALSNQLDIANKLAHAFEGVVLTLNRYQYFGGGNQSVDGQQPERRWTVDEYKVVVILDRSQSVDQASLPVKPRYQLNLGACKVQTRGSYEEAFDISRRLESVLQRCVTQQHVVHVLLNRARIEPKSGTGICLGIQVNEQNTVTHLGQGGTQIYRGGGLSDPALLIGDRNYPRAASCSHRFSHISLTVLSTDTPVVAHSRFCSSLRSSRGLMFHVKHSEMRNSRLCADSGLT